MVIPPRRCDVRDVVFRVPDIATDLLGSDGLAVRAA